MNFFKKNSFWLTLAFLLLISLLTARPMDHNTAEFDSKLLDIRYYHNVGNTWLRVSNYGFFGSGNSNPKWPSLEYHGGSGIDYLYQGALWFGAERVRRDARNDAFLWRNWPPEDSNDIFTKAHEDYVEGVSYRVVRDTLTSVGFDGDRSLYEFLPAWNPTEAQTPGYNLYNRRDYVIEASTRFHKRAFDDDGDGLIDEDPAGRAFPLRRLRTPNPENPSLWMDLPIPYQEFAGSFIHELGSRGAEIISGFDDWWFPLGFQDLSYSADGTVVDGKMREFEPIETRFLFAEPTDDDGDGLIDEDGHPVSEQDFISYYYDYNPFDGPSKVSINRKHGSWTSGSTHWPLNVRVRQMSYQWSYDYIKNLTYVEFNITNMNPDDTLYNCVMGIYMDCDTAPQSWEGVEAHQRDVSGYVSGENMEFAYTRNKVYPHITPHWLGARVVTPDPEQIDYSAWTWKVSDGPDDFQPHIIHNLGTRLTSNEKYWLLKGKQPDSSRYTDMRLSAINSVHGSWEEPDPVDTRFLFAFSGDMQGLNEQGDDDSGATKDSWNLKPFDTMKIVIAIFPGENLEDLKESASWAKDIYGDAQKLDEVVLPDTIRHYEPPEPPDFPFLHTRMRETPPNSNVINLDVLWNNRSEFTIDDYIVDRRNRGWRTDSNLDSNVANYNPDTYPISFDPYGPDALPFNEHATVNLYTAHRIRHSFQGYTLWSRSGRGDRESWVLQEKWDKIDTDQDHLDYDTNKGITHIGGEIEDEEYMWRTFGGDLGIDKGLPNRFNGDGGFITAEDIALGGMFNGRCLGDSDCSNLLPNGECGGHAYTTISGHYVDEQGNIGTLDDMRGTIVGFPYIDRPIVVGDVVHGMPIYNMITAKQAKDRAVPPRDVAPFLTDSERESNQLLFKHPALDDETFLKLVEDRYIPLAGHQGQNAIIAETGEEFQDKRDRRLAQRYYQTTIYNLPKGREFYVAVTAWSRGIAAKKLGALESGRDANMEVFFPGPIASSEKRKVFVVPNPYRGGSTFDGVVEGDALGDRSRRLWFVNLPKRANVQIYTLAGDLVAEFEHSPSNLIPVISISKEVREAYGSGTIAPWDLLSRNNQIIASGLYFFSVKDHDTGDVQVGRFAVIR